MGCSSQAASAPSSATASAPPAPGTAIYTLPGTFHQFINIGDEPVKLYFLYVPAGEAQAILDAEFR